MFSQVEDTGSEGATGENRTTNRQRRRKVRAPRTVVNPDENFYFYWLWLITLCILYNLWTLIVRQSFPELQVRFYPSVFNFITHGVLVSRTKRLSTKYIELLPKCIPTTTVIKSLYIRFNAKFRNNRHVSMFIHNDSARLDNFLIRDTNFLLKH